MKRLAAVAALGLLVVAGPPAIAQTPDTHTVEAGETLFSISRRYGVAVDELRRLNGIVDNYIRVGQRLRIPKAADDPPGPGEGVQSPPGDTPSPEELFAARRTRQGETLLSIAFSLGMPVDSLAAINGWPAGYLVPDSTLDIPRELAMREHVVRRGETLFLIARQNGTTVAELRRLNGIEGDLIRVGQILRIPSADAPGPPPGQEQQVEEGRILSYPSRFAGRLMASGRRYNPEGHTISHGTLPFGTVVLIEAIGGTGVSFAEVADRTPVGANYAMEMSDAVARALRLETSDEPLVRVRVIK